MDKYKNNGDYSKLIEKESQIFYTNIDILKSYRDQLWELSVNKTFEFLASDWYDEFLKLYNLKEELTNFKQYVPDEVYNKFIIEYNKTMYLLEKSYINLVNEDKVRSGQETQIDKILLDLEGVRETDENKDVTTKELVEEDPTTFLLLKEFCLPEDKIDEIIKAGYRFENASILDVEKNLNKHNRK